MGTSEFRAPLPVLNRHSRGGYSGGQVQSESWPVGHVPSSCAIQTGWPEKPVVPQLTGAEPPAAQSATTPEGDQSPTMARHSARVAYSPTSRPNAASSSISSCNAVRFRSRSDGSQLLDDSTS